MALIFYEISNNLPVIISVYLKIGCHLNQWLTPLSGYQKGADWLNPLKLHICMQNKTLRVVRLGEEESCKNIYQLSIADVDGMVV